MSKKLELLTKQIAADRLQLSVRRLMELSADGRLTRHLAIDPETKREAVMFDAAEVERFKTEPAAMLAPATASSSTAKTTAEYTAAARNLYERGRKLLGEAPRLPLDEYDIDDAADAGAGRLWLTLAEAAEYSGLPASYLLEMIESVELPARDVGVRPGGRWRVRRVALDAIESEAREPK